jgi:hypothetical protein
MSFAAFARRWQLKELSNVEYFEERDVGFHKALTLYENERVKLRARN